MVTRRKVTHWIRLYEAQVGGSAELNEEKTMNEPCLCGTPVRLCSTPVHMQYTVSTLAVDQSIPVPTGKVINTG